MRFEDALRALKSGRTITRELWRGVAWLEFKDSGEWVREPTIFKYREINPETRTVTREQWCPEQLDILAHDWSCR